MCNGGEAAVALLGLRITGLRAGFVFWRLGVRSCGCWKRLWLVLHILPIYVYINSIYIVSEFAPWQNVGVGHLRINESFLPPLFVMVGREV